MAWFQSLFGFAEADYKTTQAAFELQGSTLVTHTQPPRRFEVGAFSTPSLRKLREDQPSRSEGTGVKLKLQVTVGDVSRMLCDAENRLATFQVASQFNALEFVHAKCTPEDGIGGYERDRTQGPACSIACGPATVVRNYFVPVSTGNALQRGQSAEHQLNNADDLLARLGCPAEEVRVTNGYMMASDEGLRCLAAAIEAGDREALTGALKVGVHADVQVTSSSWGTRLLGDPSHLATQVFCSACPVSYNRNPEYLWQPIAELVLEAAYEATLLVAAERARQHGGTHGSRRVYLTMLGGGVFGNRMEWICGAILRALCRCRHLDLDVRIVEYSAPGSATLQLLEDWKQLQR